MKQPIKIVGLSDTHGTLLDLDKCPPSDVYCICGDIVPLDIQRDNIESIAWLCTKFFPWVQSLPCEKVVLVSGNHDFIFEYLATDRNGNHRKSKRVMKKLMAPSKLVYLEDSEFEYKGWKFWGSPWCPNLINWAWYGEDDLLRFKFSKIPNNVDVLLTHCPPRIDNFDTVLENGYNFGAKYGSEVLREIVLERKPILHIFGHIHSGQHLRDQVDGITMANVSIRDEQYRVSYDPQVFELK